MAEVRLATATIEEYDYFGELAEVIIQCNFPYNNEILFYKVPVSSIASICPAHIVAITRIKVLKSTVTVNQDGQLTNL